ncbi:MAG: MBL fold metallo-hydrolase [Balneolaceae bacterium]|nr:MBL fold metallo-hydrolase [Balneolaceae bacterium]MBO6547920.1 MBL fold metallo-hydrolase [Balneolaceae bacterium]MBO6648433.1 MBL fold metallo-hydrolase [Balneolaceae bacterium]
MFFEQIFEEKLAQYAYLIGCQRSGEAIVVDPMRDIDRYEELAAKHNLKIIAAAETHIHADYLSGLREFAERGVKVYASDEGDKDWKYEWLKGSDYNYQLLKDGDEFNIGNIKFTTVYSPGHTPEHVSYLVTDGAATDQPMGILSGDFVFVGDVGRPDLLETAAGQVGAMEGSAKVLYQSLEKFKQMPEYLQLWPGHGAGSACGKALGAVPKSTVGYEQKFNTSIRSAISEQDFVDYILDGQPEPPLYFARMKRDNKLGPKVLGEFPSPSKMSITDIAAKAQGDNAVLIDTRTRTEFMMGHLEGSLLATINKQFNTIAGSYITEEQDIYLIIEEEKIEEAVVDLIRIGLDNIVGFTTPAELIENGVNLVSTTTINFESVDDLMSTDDYNLLDVRKKSEFDQGHHPEAINISHTRLLDRIDEVPKDKPVLVHCKSGNRASFASALLESKGYEVQYIDDAVEPWLEKNNLLAGVK